MRRTTGRSEAAARDALAGSIEERGRRLACELNRYRLLLERVIDQTERRVLKGEMVSAGEKVVSIVEPHAAIIVKDGRETIYGRKVYLTGGAFRLVLDCLITGGNPADSTPSTRMIERQKEIYGRPPRRAPWCGRTRCTWGRGCHGEPSRKPRI